MFQCFTFSLQTPLTTSDILLSKTSSPGVLDELPGKGGKFEASKSNFGVGTFASAVEGWGLGILSSSRRLRPLKRVLLLTMIKGGEGWGRKENSLSFFKCVCSIKDG